MKLTETKDGVVLDIFVKPNSAKFDVQVEGDEIIVHSTEEPAKGKVNKEIVKELSKLLHRPVEIVAGATSRKKKLLVKGIQKSELQRFLGGI